MEVHLPIIVCVLSPSLSLLFVLYSDGSLHLCDVFGDRLRKLSRLDSQTLKTIQRDILEQIKNKTYINIVTDRKEGMSNVDSC